MPGKKKKVRSFKDHERISRRDVNTWISACGCVREENKENRAKNQRELSGRPDVLGRGECESLSGWVLASEKQSTSGNRHSKFDSITVGICTKPTVTGTRTTLARFFFS